MKLGRKSTVLLVVLGFVLAYLTLYTVVAHGVARHVYESDGTVVWRLAPSGSFCPWPTASGMLLILSRMNDVDVFIYTYLIKSWVLVGVTILLWVSVSLYVLKFVRVRLYQSPKYRAHLRS